MPADPSFPAGPDFGAADLDQHRSLVGETHLTGVLVAESAIHEAIGVLIAGGRGREHARAGALSFVSAARVG